MHFLALLNIPTEYSLSSHMCGESELLVMNTLKM